MNRKDTYIMYKRYLYTRHFERYISFNITNLYILFMNYAMLTKNNDKTVYYYEFHKLI